MQRQPILVLKWQGAIAHFRKFYTNSSSLSYAFPPRTVIIGMLAGIVGLERDTYYEKFKPEDFQCTVELLTSVRKISQTVNYMFVKSPNDLNRSSGPTQIPLEIVLSQKSLKDRYSRIEYRLYIKHRNLEFMREWKKRAQNSEFVYPPCFGLSELTSTLQYEAWVDGKDITELPSGNTVQIDSICPLDVIEEKGLAIDLKGTRQYIKERMPRYFSKGRFLEATRQYIYEQNGNSIVSILGNPVLKVEFNEEAKHILWM